VTYGNTEDGGSNSWKYAGKWAREKSSSTNERNPQAISSGAKLKNESKNSREGIKMREENTQEKSQYRTSFNAEKK